MIITDTMSETLSKIIQSAPGLGQFMQERQPNNESVGQYLIGLYRETDDLEIRQHIMEFMTDAGYAWLRRLFIRDDSWHAQPVSAASQKFKVIAA